jgi:hypothetical protein
LLLDLLNLGVFLLLYVELRLAGVIFAGLILVTVGEKLSKFSGFKPFFGVFVLVTLGEKHSGSKPFGVFCFPRSSQLCLFLPKSVIIERLSSSILFLPKSVIIERLSSSFI